MEKKIYVLQIEWDIEGSPEFEVLKVFEKKDDAIKELKKTRQTTIDEWAKCGTFEIERDNDTLFEYQHNNWEEYYIIKITEHSLN